ncbi:hypothetical protein Pden_0722 [Paracoccus denitrificans PD1222]|uniref:Uncharacterized protein n=1 Tax=Paracoccus denitrificans (strain Pd 1222) TaxID=318586 RepID=A1AZZ0_PARDP|nr:hypothetical protein Pden_0722 [Paracoccus denitrificans PD1222]
MPEDSLAQPAAPFGRIVDHALVAAGSGCVMPQYIGWRRRGNLSGRNRAGRSVNHGATVGFASFFLSICQHLWKLSVPGHSVTGIRRWNSRDR